MWLRLHLHVLVLGRSGVFLSVLKGAGQGGGKEYVQQCKAIIAPFTRIEVHF